MAACHAESIWFPTGFLTITIPFSVKFLPSPSNDLTEEPCSEERRRGKEWRKEVGRKWYQPHYKSITRLILKPPLLNRAENTNLWWSDLFPGFVLFFIFLWFKALYCSTIMWEKNSPAYASRLSRVGVLFRCTALVTYTKHLVWRGLLQNKRANSF